MLRNKLKHITKYIYFFCTLAMFVIFGFYMNYQLQAFNAGAYHIDGFTQAECENMGGLLIVTGGEIRCYMTPTEYVTKGDATVSPQEQEATTFAECVDAGGELYQEEFFERCYISEEKYFDQTITEQDFFDSIQDYDSCIRAGGETYPNRCYLTEEVYFQS